MAEGATFDLLVIGGGINGAGIARDAAGRGLKVALVEKNDLASATSSWSTKLIHGGLRYLEYYEFRLVRESLAEREILWRMAPHLIHPLRFVLPFQKGMRPAWMLRAGLFLYDHIGARKLLPPTRTLDLTKDAAGPPLKSGHRLAFEYSDCAVDDSRLTILTALDAAERGATILTRAECLSARREGEGEAQAWVAEIADARAGRRRLRARRVVNAAGPWVAQVLGERLGQRPKAGVRLVQGSHIVVPKLYEHERAYFFQNADGRIFFAIPYREAFTLIGTTDRDFSGDPAGVAASDEEVAYLLDAANAYFRRQLARADVVWAYSGVRPLYDDGASEARSATRDYVFELDEDGAPALSIFGGKITTYRRLAKSALATLGVGAGARDEDWTAGAPLPGGDFPVDGLPALAAALTEAYPFLAADQAGRLARAYGTRAKAWLGRAKSLADLGETFGAGLTQAEVDYLVDVEWALNAEDVLWRRSKLGLTMPPEGAARLADYLAQKTGCAPPPTNPRWPRA